MSITTEEPVTAELVPYAPGVMEEYRPRILMDAEEAKTLDDQLRKCMLAVLREGTDFGTIPGAGDKKNLLKPGAEKLLQWFGFGSRSIEVKIERDDPEYPSGIADKVRRVGVTYRTEVTKTVPGGEVIVATCEGYAGYDEDRYFATAAEARAKAEARERSNAARYDRRVNTSKWEFITADYRAPWNTLIKMAQKRSYVGAAIDATGAAGLFTQDMEDMGAAAAVPPAFAATARAAIATLPRPVTTELDAWYSALNWPEPNAWDPDQWCKALIKAGKLSIQLAPPEAQGSADGNGQHNHALAEPAAGGAPATATWFDHALSRANADDLTKDEAGKLWTDATARNKAGTLPDDVSRQLKSVLTGRLEKFKAAAAAPAGEIVEAEIVEDTPAADPASVPNAGTQDAEPASPGMGELDPADPWAAKVECIVTLEDVEAAMADLNLQLENGTITEERYRVVSAAIDRKAAAIGAAASARAGAPA